jgi:site-specific recombinase XerD
MQVSIYKKDFLNEMRSLYRKSTFVTIQSWTNRYVDRWLPANGYPDASVADAFSLGVLRKYRDALNKSGVCPRTIHAAFFPLRKFNTFLADPEIGVLSDGVVKRVELPKKGYGTRLSVSDEIVTKLFEVAGRQYDPAKVALSEAILATLTYAGVRAFELVGIETGHVSLTDGTLFIKDGKGGKSRLLYPGPAWLKAMVVLLECRKQKGCPETNQYLFVRGPRANISDEYLRKHVKELAAMAGLAAEKHITPHGFRHGFATRMLRNGANIKEIQAALGHENPETTLKYLAQYQEDVKAMAVFGAMTPSPAAKDQPVPASEARRAPVDRRRPATVVERSLRRNVR